MKTHLSHILPVWKACDILGRPVVQRIVSSLLHYRQSTSSNPTKTDDEELQAQIDLLVDSLLFRPPLSTASSASPADENETTSSGPKADPLSHPSPSDNNNTNSASTGTRPAAVAAPTIDPSRSVPAPIFNAWKRWLGSKLLALDKPTLLQFFVPTQAQPHTGPSGHMGLYDCLIYTLQGHAVSSSAAYYGGATSLLVWLPDALILLAIAKAYRSHQEQARMRRKKKREETTSTTTTTTAVVMETTSTTTADHPQDQDEPVKTTTTDEPPPPPDAAADDDSKYIQHAERVVGTMAILAYRMYDSYQKKGTVARDTIHRFLTDVHGEDSYKEPKAQALLDIIFNDREHVPGWLQATVSEGQFVKRILSTADLAHGRPHLLLDWMSMLMSSMIPAEEIPHSVAAYLDTMDHQPRPLSETYALADHRLFEIKRRFHSLVQSSAPVIVQGDPMGSSSSSTNSATDGDASSSQQPYHEPRHAIRETAFCQALTTANEEMGHGGYMPESLARLVFWAGGRNQAEDASVAVAVLHHNAANSSGGDDESLQHCKLYWGLYHVVQFGCIAVRHNTSLRETDSETPLMRFMFGMFQQPPLPNDDTTITTTGTDDSSSSNNNAAALMMDTIVAAEQTRHVLTRSQVARMLRVLVEYVDFRLQADAPRDQLGDPVPVEPEDNEDSNTNNNDETTLGGGEEIKLDAELCALLGLVPPSNHTTTSDKKTITLKKLVDHTLKNTADKNQMSFEEFCEWNKAKESDNKGPTILAPLMMELRLIASILFGIPPTLGSMEIAIIAEIERRHRCRYPQSDVSRRGPRGTVWYIIDAPWFNGWTNHVKSVSGTAEDPKDGRGDKKNTTVRGIRRISNTSLLVENGSLALRPDIRWRHDYEILPPLAWSALQAWYDGGPPIHRSVVRFVSSSGPSSPHSPAPRIPTENEIELYPLFVTIYMCDAASRGEARPFQQNHQLSRVSPVGIPLVQLCRELDVDPDAARLWILGKSDPGDVSAGAADEPGSSEDDWILSLDMNIIEQRKRRGSKDAHGRLTLLLEIKDTETGVWPRSADGKERSLREKEPEQNQTDLGDGIVGLYNMGNTCYLNSSIQCLSHTPIFREYFTSRSYLKDVNTTNPLGHEGQMAQVSAVLINSLWKRFNQTTPHQSPKRITTPGSYALVNAPALTPKTFKDSLSKFNEHFSGNEQHDAQELLAFLLGGLSEDLNRIVDKPYIEAPDSDGRPDGELADIWWSNHLKREMSIIVALFTGQYKSLLTCRTCKYESARFEPFSFLQLPLPEDDHHSVTLVFYHLKEGSGAIKYCVRVHVDGDLGDVLVALAKVLHKDETEGGDAGSPGKDNKSKEKDQASDELIKSISRNLAVVDMRDGYISKIAPNAWTLHDLQNKETGELPLLHVFELDPISDTENESQPALSKTEGEMDATDTSNGPKQKHAFLAVAQRRSELVSRDHLHPLAHRVFGTPLLLRIDNFDNFTGRELYDLVAKRLRNVVPKSALRFLTTSTVPNPKADSEPHELTRTTTDMEEVSAGTVPRYGFRLRLTTRDGRRCLSCPWYECCVGCLIHDSGATTDVMDGDSIVVDWHFAVDVATAGFGRRTSPTDPIVSQQAPTRPRSSGVTIKNHSSCGTGPKKGAQAGAITLEDCLDAFAREEKIPEAYCSKCKDFRVQTKRMSLWRLPPVVIIHLKRFQFTQQMRRKLRDLVVFPIEGLDLSRIMAQESKAPSEAKTKENGSTPDGSDEKEGETEGDHATEDHLKDSGRSENLYDLYGVVHHQGALSGGHYVASLKSELDGQWRLFNDAQIYEIHARDVVDASAYILFYIRRDVSKAKLSDFWDIREGQGISEADMDQLLKGRSDRCVIS